MRTSILTLAGLVATALAFAAEDTAVILERQTQELLDAVSTGSAAVWERYVDAGVSYTNEEGTVMSKSQLLEEIKPLPEGVSGNIKVTDFKVTVHGSVAVATHVDDEHETYHGHQIHCQYRATDTWLKTSDGWRLIANQTLALRTDPPSIRLTPAQIEEYNGSYALTPAIKYAIRTKDGSLEGERTGRKPEVWLAEGPDVFFTSGQPRYRKVFLRGPDGHITGFAERREAWDIVWKRVP